MEVDILSRKFEEVWRSLKNESLRGSVIIAAAVVDEALEELLKARLLPSLEGEDKLFKGANAPINNMASRVELAYRVGCISEKIYKSLHILRKLRNDFAHISLAIDFNTDSVRDRTRALLELNRPLIEFFWPKIRPELFEMAGIKNEPKMSGDILSDMLAHAGYRHTFEIWASSVAGVLAEEVVNAIRIEKLTTVHS